MEGYSPIFSSSSNSASSSSTTFPFSLNTQDYDHHHDNQNSYHHLINHDHMMTMDRQQHEEHPILDNKFAMVQSSQTGSFYHHSDNNHDVNDNYVNNKGISNLFDGEKVKKGSSSEKKNMRKHRYAFQTRSQVDILDDGYRWRKYGQKAVKNNKFPRSYYRCTVQGCNVKKQVQRLSKDEGVVVTTYEGIHSHPIDKSTDNFEHILSRMQIYTSS